MRFGANHIKRSHYVYCITHTSGKRYVGQYNKNPEIRFLEHLTGYGNICIWELVCSGESRDNFKFEILQDNIPASKIYEEEAKWVQQLCSVFPFGFNAGFSSAFYKKYVKLHSKYVANQWCTKLLDCIIIDKIDNLTSIQDKIELLAKNQTFDVNMMSFSEMEKWRIHRRRGYSRKNVFLTKDMTNFFIAREKEYERVRAGKFTEAEIKAQSTRSDSMKKVWSKRSKEDRIEILKNATESAAIKNRKKDEDKKN